MATYDLEEQEQMDELKAWWKRWGSLTMLAVALALAAVAATAPSSAVAAAFQALTTSGDQRSKRDSNRVTVPSTPLSSRPRTVR